jgi:hypothetical protein
MATITSTRDGDWGAGATWVGGGIPGDTSDVVINHKVGNLSFVETCKSITINDGGELTLATIDALTVTSFITGAQRLKGFASNIICPSVTATETWTITSGDGFTIHGTVTAYSETSSALIIGGGLTAHDVVASNGPSASGAVIAVTSSLDAGTSVTITSENTLAVGLHLDTNSVISTPLLNIDTHTLCIYALDSTLNVNVANLTSSGYGCIEIDSPNGAGITPYNGTSCVLNLRAKTTAPLLKATDQNFYATNVIINTYLYEDMGAMLAGDYVGIDKIEKGADGFITYIGIDKVVALATGFLTWIGLRQVT